MALFLFKLLLELLLLLLELPDLHVEAVDVYLTVADSCHLTAQILVLITRIKGILENSRHVAVLVDLLLPAHILPERILGDLLKVGVSLSPSALQLLVELV